jgi:hypothetical protein
MGVGNPNYLYLDEFASQLRFVFGDCIYHVGSSLTSKQFRDVDVRAIINDSDWEDLELGDPGSPHQNGKWVALTLAFCELGKRITGLPIDFQIQQRSYANEHYGDAPRSWIGSVPLRIIDSRSKK